MAGVDEATPAAGSPGAKPGDAQVFRFSTAAFREHERIAAWREVFGRTLLKINLSPHSSEGFHASAKILRAPGIGVIRSWTAAVDMANAPGLISNDDITLGCVLTSKWNARQLRRDTDLEPGDGVLMSNSDLGGLLLPETCRFVTFGVPRSAVAPLVPDIGDWFGGRIPRQNPAYRLLLRYLELADDEAFATDSDLPEAFAGHICDLLVLALGAARDAAAVALRRGVPAARLRAMQDDIRRSCHRPDLSVYAIAAQHNVSVRYVQRVFEESGTTFTQYLTEQRLACAYRELRSAASAERPISTIAYDCGFSDVSHFNRLFRRRFDGTPTEVRRSRRREED